MSYRSRKLLNAAKGQSCTNCGMKNGTTVAAHVRMVALGSGTGIKAPDCLCAWLCGPCHDRIDDRVKCYSSYERRDRFFMALARTIVQLFEQGIVKVV